MKSAYKTAIAGLFLAGIGAALLFHGRSAKAADGGTKLPGTYARFVAGSESVLRVFLKSSLPAGSGPKGEEPCSNSRIRLRLGIIKIAARRRK